MIYPLTFIACGLMIARVQLLKIAVVGCCRPKKRLISRSALSAESEPWQAFFVWSVPNMPRIELGASSLGKFEFEHAAN
jgi:hypothetical protein